MILPLRFGLPRPAGVFLLGLWMAAFFFGAGAAQAQQPFGQAPGYQVRLAPVSIAAKDICVLHPGGVVPASEVQPRGFLRGPAFQQTANFEVNYIGFTGAEGQEAREAFQRAVDIWAQHINSPVTIKVEAAFEELGENVLGSAGPNRIWYLINEDAPQDLSCTDQSDPRASEFCTLYGDALADAVLGQNVAELSDAVPDDAPDIFASFSSEANWYYGTGEPAANQIDFTSVVLHELGHGLGFFGSMTVENADADPEEEGLWPYDVSEPDVPAIYDRFAVDESGTLLINTDVYPNPSVDLRRALTTGRVFFEGDGALTGNDGVLPELYTPATWNQGSSYSHVDESIYPAGDPNALMSPQIGFREVFKSPGSITCGMFRDMGWGMGPACRALLQSDIASFQASYLGERGVVEVVWVTQPTPEAERFVLRRANFPGGDTDAEFVTVASFDLDEGVACTPGEDEGCQEGGLRFSFETDALGVGRYEFRLQTVGGDGDDGSNLISFGEPGRVQVGLVGPPTERIEIELVNNFNATLSWRVPAPTEGFRYGTFSVQRCVGAPEECNDGPYQTIGTVEGSAGEQRFAQEQATAPIILGPGNYAYRLAMEVIDTEAPNEGTTYVVLSDDEFLTGEDDFDFEVFALSEIYPNPTTDRAVFNLTVENSQDVTVSVYNTLGQRVRFFSRRLQGGQAQLFTLDGAGLSSGLYLVRISGSEFEERRRFVFVQ